MIYNSVLNQQKYLRKFPNFKDFKKEMKNEGEDYENFEFYNEWIDSAINQLLWEIVTDHSNQSISEDEKDYVEKKSDEEFYLMMAENIQEQIKKNIRNSITDEEIFERMPKKLKEKYDALGKEIKILREISAI